MKLFLKDKVQDKMHKVAEKADKNSTFQTVATKVGEKKGTFLNRLEQSNQFKKIKKKMDRELKAGEQFIEAPKSRLSKINIGKLYIDVTRVYFKTLGNEYYVKIKLEDKEEHCDVANMYNVGGKPPPTKKSKLLGGNVKEFEITDITADVRLQLYLKYTVLSDKLLGQVLIPLRRLLPKDIKSILHIRDATKKEVLPFEKSKCFWYKIYPLLHESKHKFYSGVEEWEGTAMERPTEDIGFVEITLKISLTRSVLSCYLVSSPYIPSSQENKQFDPPELKRNFTRVARIAGGRSSHHTNTESSKDEKIGNNYKIENVSDDPRNNKNPVLILFAHILSWDSLPLSIFALVFIYYICIKAPLYSLPLHFAIALIIYSYYTKNRKSYDYIMTWNDEIELDPDDPVTYFGQAVKAKNILLKMQLAVGEVASCMEKLSNLLTWIDPTITLVAHIFFFFSAIVLAVFLYVVDYVMDSFNLTLGKIICICFTSIMIISFFSGKIKQTKGKIETEKNVNKNQNSIEKIETNESNIDSGKKENNTDKNKIIKKENPKINTDDEEISKMKDEKQQHQSENNFVVENEIEENKGERDIEDLETSENKGKKIEENLLLRILYVFLGKILIYASNIIDRIPDDPEVCHWIIAEQQIYNSNKPITSVAKTSITASTLTTPVAKMTTTDIASATATTTTISNIGNSCIE